MKIKFLNRWKNEKWGERHKWHWHWSFTRYCFCPMDLTTPNGSFIPFAFEVENPSLINGHLRNNFHFTILNFDWRIYK